ncbi:hypothetical protein LCGC14_2631880 [marine sediment metagenome]|uniref:Uncharacterized protein n=1 Tax=marine sediment metagenome TaxID=412755 RepID=A0A0F9CB08_9ZZZZ
MAEKILLTEGDESQLVQVTGGEIHDDHPGCPDTCGFDGQVEVLCMDCETHQFEIARLEDILDEGKSWGPWFLGWLLGIFTAALVAL